MRRSTLRARYLRSAPAGEPGPGGGGGSAAGQTGGSSGGAGQGGQGGAGKAADLGFPADTPTASMPPDQQAAYWQHRSRQWEDRAKVFDGLTAESFAELKAKAERADKLDYDLSSEHEKAIADARAAGATEAAGTFVPEVVAAKLDAAAARAGVTEEQLTTALKYVDYEKFLNDDGKVDAEMVTGFVAAIKPAMGTPGKGPSLTGHGTTGPTGSSGRERGLEEARKRFPQPATK